MRLERASAKAVRYAIMNWHYSKSVPLVQVAYAVFNGGGEWCGVVCYSIGASNNIAKPYGMELGQVIELVRVALNGKQESTSQAVGLSLKLIKKECPLVQMVVSYADTGEGHVGTIYQACNWVYCASRVTEPTFIKNGKKVHSRLVSSSGQKKQFGVMRSVLKPSDMDSVLPGTLKHKYIYPLTKEARTLAETLRKPYPKKPTPAPEAQTDERLSSTQEDGGAVPTPALTYSLP